MMALLAQMSFKIDNEIEYVLVFQLQKGEDMAVEYEYYVPNK